MEGQLNEHTVVGEEMDDRSVRELQKELESVSLDFLRMNPPRLPEDESLLKNMSVVTLDEPFKLSVPDSPHF